MFPRAQHHLLTSLISAEFIGSEASIVRPLKCACRDPGTGRFLRRGGHARHGKPLRLATTTTTSRCEIIRVKKEAIVRLLCSPQ